MSFEIKRLEDVPLRGTGNGRAGRTAAIRALKPGDVVVLDPTDVQKEQRNWGSAGAKVQIPVRTWTVNGKLYIALRNQGEAAS